jgi:hypothetical protein
LSRIIEVLEAAQEIGEQVDLAVLTQVLDALEVEYDQAARQVPPTARRLTEEEQTTALVLAVVGGALENVIGYLEQRSDFHRLRNELQRVRDGLAKSMWQNLYARMTKEVALGLMTESSAWKYVILSPDEARFLPELLRHLSGGGRVTKEMRQRAGDTLERFAGIAPAPEGKAG